MPHAVGLSVFDRHDIVSEAVFVPILYSLLYRVSFKEYSY